MKRVQSILIVCIPLELVSLAALGLDHYAATSLSPIFAGLVFAIGLLFAVPVCILVRDRYCVLPIALFAVLLVILPYVSLSPVKPFKRFYGSITPGMSEKEILQKLALNFPETGRYPRPLVKRNSIGDMVLVLDPLDSRYDAEFVFITFDEGPVSRKEYLAD